jgi:2,4-dienoyl-CoA reductase-like NADH-dependent reductase (Old Yellow Enzyme family)
MNQFPLLFSPLKIGSFTVRNRIMSTPHHTLFTDPDGLPGSREIAYWVSKAKGGIGLIGSHVHGIHASTGNTFAQPAAVQKFAAAAEAIHEHGARFIGQLWHPGAQGGGPTRVPWAPSTVPHPDSWSIPHPMSKSEVREVIDGYARGAAVLREAGVDGAEIHGAHGYMITQFLSPLSNTRDDEYGGDFERRLNFPLEIIEAIRREVGRDWTVGMRISGDEMTEGGYTTDDFRRLAPYLTANNQLDYLSVSVGIYRSKDTIIAPMYYPSGAFVYLAAMAKEVIDIPVVCIGRINDPVMAEKILQDNQSDMVGMTRANICDAELPNKSREGRLDEIRHCIACNEGCWGHIERQMPITCAINPAVGREEYWGEVRKTDAPRRVVVVGGGPAGCEAARIAAMAGHSVTLFEKEPELGGQANIAARGPGRVDFGEVGRYQAVELNRLRVDLRLGRAASASDVLASNPEAVFLATGGRPRVPEHIAGINGANVVQAWDVLKGNVSTGEKVIVLDEEHHIQALNVAELLASQGKQVQVVTHQFEAGALMEPITQLATMRRINGLGIPVRTATWLKEVGEGYAILYDITTSREERVDADTVVLACSIVPEDGLAEELRAAQIRVTAIGDVNGYRRLEQSVFEGHLAARSLDGPVDPRVFASARRLG